MILLRFSLFFFFKQKTAYDVRISDWSSDVCSSDLDHAGIEQVLAAAVEQLGGLHIAVNTAGGGTVAKTLGKNGPHPIEDFANVINLNLVSTFNLNRLQALHMSHGEPDEDGERGVIINTSSIAAFAGQIGQVAYSAAQAGLARMALTMDRDLGPQGLPVPATAPRLSAQHGRAPD